MSSEVKQRIANYNNDNLLSFALLRYSLLLLAVLVILLPLAVPYSFLPIFANNLLPRLRHKFDNPLPERGSTNNHTHR